MPSVHTLPYAASLLTQESPIQMKFLKKRKPKIVPAVECPVCGRYHTPDVEFGPFCCASCLQMVIRPLGFLDPKRPLPR